MAKLALQGWLPRHKLKPQAVVDHGEAPRRKVDTLRRYCKSGAVLENGKLTYFDDINDAIRQHEANMGAAHID